MSEAYLIPKPWLESDQAAQQTSVSWGVNSWDRQPDESTKAYAAFCAYRDLHSGRSLTKAWVVYKQAQNRTKTGPIQGYFKSWSSHHNWVQRAQDYDRHLNAIELQHREDQAIARINDIIELEWGLSQALHEKALEMLQHPLTEERVDHTEVGDEGVIHQQITVKPVRASLRDACALVETASRLARRSLGFSEEANVLQGQEESSRLYGIEIIPPTEVLDDESEDPTS